MYTLVLTHDVDYLSLKEVPWTCRTLWGFSYRCLNAALRVPGLGYTLAQRARLLWNGISMPLIKLGLMADPWEASLDMVVDMEKRLGVRSTFYFIPYPDRPGVARSGEAAPSNRAAFYDVRDHRERIRALEAGGWEIGVHGIDAYRNEAAARQERQRIAELLGHDRLGIRMHWLYSNDRPSWEIFSRAGYRYDASYGWNEKVGFPGERYVPFRPFEGDAFELLPLNIQDQALLGENDVTEEQAWEIVKEIIGRAKEHNAVVTILWHNTSYAMPWLWGPMYERIVRQAQADGARIVRAIDAVNGD